jgi:hypothetical protein
MEGLFPLSRMAAGGRVFGEKGNVLPSTPSMITGMEMLPQAAVRSGPGRGSFSFLPGVQGVTASGRETRASIPASGG